MSGATEGARYCACDRRHAMRTERLDARGRSVLAFALHDRAECGRVAEQRVTVPVDVSTMRDRHLLPVVGVRLDGTSSGRERVRVADMCAGCAAAAK